MKNGVMRRQEPETIRKRETILFIIKMQKKTRISRIQKLL